MESPESTHAEDSPAVITKIKSGSSPSNGTISKMSDEKPFSLNDLESDGAKMDIDGEEDNNLSTEVNGVKQQSNDMEEESNDAKSLDFQLDPDSSFGSDTEKPSALEIETDSDKKKTEIPPEETDISPKAPEETKIPPEETEISPEEMEEDFIGFDENVTPEIKPIITKEDISKVLTECEHQLLTESVNPDGGMDYEEGGGSSDVSDSSKKTTDRRSVKRISVDDTAGVTDSSDGNKADDEGESLEVITPNARINLHKVPKASGRQSGTDSPVTGGRRSGKRTSTFDISNPAFQKPFDYGWKRELVYRNASGSDSSSKIQADVYYYTPNNKKIRSNREVSEHLSGSELTTENFTFFKEALGINDPHKEIIRSAAHRSSIVGEGFLPIKKSPKKKEVKELKPPKEIKTPKEPKPPKESKTPKDKTPKTPRDDFKEVLSVTGPRAVIGARKGAFPRIKVTAVSSKSPSHKTVASSKTVKKASDDGDMEMGMLPPSWSPSPNKTSTDTATAPAPAPTPTPAAQAAAPEPKAEPEAVPTPTTTTAVKRKAETEEESNMPKRLKSDEALVERRFMENFVSNVAEGYNALLQVFQYLKTQELLRAARVCRMWRDLAGHRSLWRTVRLKNSHVDDWQGLMDALTRHGTQHLDLRKILLSNDIPENEQLWRTFGEGIAKVPTLTRIDLCRCPPYVIEDIALGCPQLTTLNALSIKCSAINLTSLGNLKNLVELRLKSMTGTKLDKSLQPMKELTNLKYLAMTTFKDIGQAGCENFKYLTNLEVLELGECLDLPENFGEDVLMKLTKLERLRLEKGQGKCCHTFRLLAAIKELPKLNQLELINFDVKIGFDAALAQCSNVKRLLLIPTYVTQSATTNYLILEGATKLKATLSHFVWGVTQELLRVTELFVDQCDSAGSKSPVKAASKKEAKLSESIPILKHGSLERMENLENLTKEELKDGKSQAGQVEIQTLHKLQQQLIAALPNTKIKIVKIPFQATWKQTIAYPPHH